MRQVEEVAFQLTLELAKGKKHREETEDSYAEELVAVIERIDQELAEEQRSGTGYERLVA